MNMRKNLFFSATAVVLSLLATAGCSKENTFGWNAGDNIQFGARTQSSVLTRAAYSGSFTTGTPVYERIDWEAGDKIRVLSDQTVNNAGDPTPYYDYTVQADGTADDRYSYTTIDNDNSATELAKTLHWGSSSAHTFYGVYPTSGVTTATSTSPCGTFTGYISEDQTPASGYISKDGSGNYTLIPNLAQYMMMTAKHAGVTPSDYEKLPYDKSSLFLDFYPVTTAIQFTITNSMVADFDVKSIELESANYNLSGYFTVDLSDSSIDNGDPSGHTAAATGTPAATKTVSMTFSTGGTVKIANGKSLTFTFFINPGQGTSNVNDLVFRITNQDGKIRSAKLADSSGDITFKTHHKTIISGMFLPEDIKWSLLYNPQIDPWMKDPSTIIF